MSLKNSLLRILLTFFVFSSPLFPQGQTGKLVGIVLDAATNEPLIGANVLLEGTNIGAATNVEGKFIILNIPPGKYNVIASMVGYTKVIEKNVEIFIDRTTQVNIKLSDETVQLEQVVVVAKRPPIIKDRTSSQSHIDDKQIQAAPIEGLRGALDLTSGFQKDQRGN